MKAKKIASVLMLIGMFVVVALLSSCEKQEMEEVVVASSNQQAGEQASPDSLVALRAATLASDVTYYSTPGVGVWTANSSRNLPIKGICGTAEGGVIKARVTRQVNGTFEVEIIKQNRGFFLGMGVAYIKAGSPCGGIASQKSYSAFSQSIKLSFSATFNTGYVHFYPMVIDGKTGVRYYAEPILVYTYPLFNSKGSYTQGEELATANGVVVKAAGKGLYDANELSVQCTEFCNRYYSQVYKKNIVNKGKNGGHGRDWYREASAKGLDAFPNSGTVAPRPGDILCFTGGPGGYGHVAIIMEVANTYIKIVHQNMGTVNKKDPKTYWHEPVGAKLDYDYRTKTISSPEDYTVKGWLRMPMY